jgi:hypothetical protein
LTFDDDCLFFQRQSAALNTTFEKEDEEATEVKPVALNIEQVDETSPPVAEEEKFHTPTLADVPEPVHPTEDSAKEAEEAADAVDLPSDGNVEKLLEAILGLFDQVDTLIVRALDFSFKGFSFFSQFIRRPRLKIGSRRPRSRFRPSNRTPSTGKSKLVWPTSAATLTLLWTFIVKP